MINYDIINNIMSSSLYGGVVRHAQLQTPKKIKYIMTENDNENEYKIYCARTSYEHNIIYR